MAKSDEWLFMVIQKNPPQGGLNLPNFHVYYNARNLVNIVKMLHKEAVESWVSIEQKR